MWLFRFNLTTLPGGFATRLVSAADAGVARRVITTTTIRSVPCYGVKCAASARRRHSGNGEHHAHGQTTMKYPAGSYTIARLAQAAGVHVETIRYYQRLKLIPRPLRPVGGIRRYSEADAERVRFIKHAQAMGFTLAETASLLSLQSRGVCHDTRDLIATKLRLVDARIRKLRKVRGELAHLVAECDANTQDANCPAIQRLASLTGVRDTSEPSLVFRGGRA